MNINVLIMSVLDYTLTSVVMLVLSKAEGAPHKDPPTILDLNVVFSIEASRAAWREWETYTRGRKGNEREALEAV